MPTARENCSSDEVCSIERAIRSAGSEWSLIISHYLLDGPKGFNELLRAGRNDDLNSRTLSRVLKFLAGQGIVDREIVSTQPFSVSYSLTEKGKGLEPILSAYRAWGLRWLSPGAAAGHSPALEVQTRSRLRI